MSSFCQNVDLGSPSSLSVKSTSESPGSLSRSDEISSSSCGFAGSSSEYDFSPKRPVTSITSRDLPPPPRSRSPWPWPWPPPPYSRKLIAVAHLPSGIVLTSWTFLPWPIAGAANTSATPSAPTTDPLSLTEPPSEKWLPSGGGRYSPRAHSALSPSPPRVLLVRCAPQPANGCAYGTRGGS